jgi:hypothetical protein
LPRKPVDRNGGSQLNRQWIATGCTSRSRAALALS